MAAAGGADKKALREAAERIEQGIERYAAGDVAACTREFEEALALVPGHARALQCLSWVKDLQSGKRSLGPKPGAVDEDTLQQVTDLLNDQPGFDLPVEETTRRPAPQPAADAPISSAPPPAPAPAPSITPRTFEPATPVRRGDSSTLMGVGINPFEGPLLTPTPRPSPLYAPEENTASRTREWRGTPTGTNLPLLDVPELTDEQVQELVALDAPPGPSPIVEMEADPTPLPHRNPMLPQEAQQEPPDPMKFPSGEFDALDQTPTRDRSSMLKAIAEYDQQAPAASEEDLQLPPLEVSRDFSEEGGTNPTNPFIQRRLMQQRGTGTQPRIEELPAPPLRVGYDTNETPALEPHLPLQEAIDRGDFTAAVDAAEKFVADAGGLDSPQAQPQQWLLLQAYEMLIGGLDKVPSHGQATPDLDPRSAFMLSRIDGMSSAEDLLEISGMPKLEALRLLALLVRRGVVAMK